MSLNVLFVDLNSYFASVEQQLRPELRGKPVAVVPLMTDRTSCIAASYEAKAFGVRTGTNVGMAKRMCPGLVLVKGRTFEYVEFHHKVLAAAETVLPVQSVNSIDEFWCRLLGKQRERAEAERLALAVKRAITSQVGVCMRSSIGIAPNRMLAKLASDMEKPDGLTIIEKHELPARLHALELIDFPGIGSKMVRRLAVKGIASVEQLCNRTALELEEAWESVVGRWWHDALRGEDLHERPTIRRSIGHQHVLPPELRSEAGSRAVAIRLLTKAAARTRALGYWPRHFSVSVRHIGDRSPEGARTSRTWSEDVRFPECNDTVTLMELLCDLWERYPVWASGGPPCTPLRVSIMLDDLIADASATPSLFGAAKERRDLSKAMDKVNAKFGKNAVYLGSMHDTRASAPSRIAFGSIPDATWEEVDQAEELEEGP